MRFDGHDAFGSGYLRGLIDADDAGPWDGINDGLHGGFGGFGTHVMLPNGLTRHLDTCHSAHLPGRDGFGVLRAETTLLYPGSAGPRMLHVLGHREREMFAVRRTWREREVRIDVEVLPGARGCWFKEPKVCANGFTFAPGVVRELDKNGRVLRRHLVAHKRNPRRSTRQMMQPSRRTVSMGVFGKVRVSLHGAGLALWRADVLHLKRPPRYLEPERYVEPYCHAELRPSWELVRWPKRCGILFCAWTGGAGQHECWSAGRPAIPGRTYSVTLTLQRR